MGEGITKPGGLSSIPGPLRVEERTDPSDLHVQDVAQAHPRPHPFIHTEINEINKCKIHRNKYLMRVKKLGKCSYC